MNSSFRSTRHFKPRHKQSSGLLRSMRQWTHGFRRPQVWVAGVDGLWLQSNLAIYRQLRLDYFAERVRNGDIHGHGLQKYAFICASHGAFVVSRSLWLGLESPVWEYRANLLLDGASTNNFGNFNYGVTCSDMGWSLFLCQSAAGLAHDWRAHSQGLPLGKGIPFLIPPYGDQAPDQAQIANGYNYLRWKRRCRK
jgi:hypothetical protein